MYVKETNLIYYMVLVDVHSNHKQLAVLFIQAQYVVVELRCVVLILYSVVKELATTIRKKWVKENVGEMFILFLDSSPHGNSAC